MEKIKLVANRTSDIVFRAINIVLILYLIIALIFGLRPTLIVKSSMEPTLASGSIHLAKLIDAESLPDVGSIVTFYTDSQKHYCKRLIGHSGDKISYSNGCLYVNDEFFDDLSGTGIHGFDEIDWELIVDEGCFFVLGDNRAISLDSRDLGCFPYDRLESEILF